MKSIGKIIIASTLLLITFTGNAQDVKSVLKSDDVKEVKCTTPPTTAKRITKQPNKKFVRPMKREKIEKRNVIAVPVKEK